MEESKAVQCGEFVDVAVWKRTLDGDVHLGEFFSNLLRILAMIQMRLNGCRRAAKLQVGLSIDVGCLDVADSVWIAAVEDNAVCWDLLILDKIQDVSDANVLRRDFDDHFPAEDLHHLAVRNLDDHKRQAQT